MVNRENGNTQDNDQGNDVQDELIRALGDFNINDDRPQLPKRAVSMPLAREQISIGSRLRLLDKRLSKLRRSEHNGSGVNEDELDSTSLIISEADRNRRNRSRSIGNVNNANMRNANMRTHSNRNYGNNDRYNRSMEPSTVSMTASNNYMYKKALNVLYVFSGEGSKLSFHEFKRKINYHSRIYDLLPRDLYKILMNGTNISDDALDVLQLNIDQINPYFNDEDEDIYRAIQDGEFCYKNAVKVIWELLEDHYGQKDRVQYLVEQLKRFKQASTMNTITFLAKFNTKLNELKLEIRLRNKDRKIYIEMTTFEYGQILLGNLRADVMEYVIKNAVELYHDDDHLSYQQILKLVENYTKIERVKKRVLAYSAGTNSAIKPKAIYMIENDDINNNYANMRRVNDEYHQYHPEINQIRMDYRNRKNDNVDNRRTGYCYYGKKLRCRRQGCKFQHLSNDANAAEVRKFFDSFRNKICNRDPACSNLYCPYKHTLERRKKLGDGREDGGCKFVRCKFYHLKQRYKNIEEKQNQLSQQQQPSQQGHQQNYQRQINQIEVQQQQQQQQQFNNVAAIMSIELDEINQNEDAVNKIMDNINQKDMMRIIKKMEDDDMVQYVFNDEEAKNDDIKYKMVTKDNMDKLQKITQGYRVWATNYELKGFIDGGDKLFETFTEYMVKGSNKKITLIPAGGGTTYATCKRIRVPLEVNDFSIAKNKWLIKKKILEFWYMNSLQKDMVLIGRDGMRTLGLGIFEKASLKFALYTKLRNSGFNVMKDPDEETNSLFSCIEYRHKGEPGIYLVNEATNKAEVVNINDDDITKYMDNKINLLQKQDIHKINDDIKIMDFNDKIVINIGSNLEKNINELNLNEVYKKMHYNDKPEISSELRQNEILKLLRNNNRLIHDPTSILEKITFGTALGEDGIIKLKQEIVSKGLINVFTAKDWDLSIVEGDEFKLKIKDPDNCCIKEPYSLTRPDTIILNKEIDLWIQSGSMHLLKQQEICLHASPAFVVHRHLGTTSDGKQVVKSRAAVDFTELNSNTFRYHNQWDITMEEVQSTLSKYEYFNSTDISKYFYCLAVEQESKKYGGITWYTENGRKRVGIMDVVMHGLMDAPIYGQELTAKAYANTDCVAVQDDIFGGALDLQLAPRLQNFTSILCRR